MKVIYEDSWTELIAHSASSTLWDIGKHILAERNRRNKATTNHEGSTVPHIHSSHENALLRFLIKH